jgi:ketosteroid isomerase-like protein
MSDHDDIIEANRNFYRAFETLELEKMEEVWLRDQKIACIHPGWRKLSGWGPVMQSWEGIFNSAFEMKFEVRELEIFAADDLAVVITEENLTQRGYDGGARSQVIATNVFERIGQKWLMISHHGSPVMMHSSSDEEPPLQ